MKLSVSNAFIVISTIFTIFSFQNPELITMFWMSHLFLSQWDYVKLLIQFCLYSFLHGGFFHLLFNSLFLYFFWNQLEYLIWKTWYIVFFIFTTLFNGIALLLLTQEWTITFGISWFALAIISFYTLLLYDVKNPEYKWWITALVINILVWFSPQVSFVWHLFGAISWGIFYGLYKFLGKK